VSIAAGHKNLATTLEMYVGNSAGAIDRLRMASSATKKKTQSAKRSPAKKSTPTKRKHGSK
jgi:hypothetical protein